MSLFALLSSSDVASDSDLSVVRPFLGLHLSSCGPFVRRLSLTLLCSTSLTALVYAQEIDTTLTEGVKTSTINNGSAADILIESSGSIEKTETDGFIAVTVDSNNSVVNEGEIDIEDGDDTIGIFLTPGFSGNVTNSGTISVYESYEREDEDDDDDLDGAYAIGSNRYGILLGAGGNFTGDIITDAGSSIYVAGNGSAAIALWSSLTGNISLDGSLYVLGDNATALDVAADVTGNVLVSGSVSAKGENATGIDISGNIDGSFVVESLVSSTGFDSTALTNYIAPSYVDEDTEALGDRLDAEVLLDNTAGVSVTGSIANGFLINGAVDDYTSEEDEDDEIKDTVDDFDENRTTGSVYSYGSGAAVLISADKGTQTGDLIIGNVVENVRDTTDDDDDDDISELLAQFTYDQGFINRGIILANGLNVGYDATAVRIEGELTGIAQTIINGGILNTGSVTATAFEADATAFSFGRGAVIGSLKNDGAILVNSYTTDANSAIAVLLEEGASLSEIENSGTITVQTIGRSGHSVGIRDLSSTVTSFTNMGTIYVYHTVDGEIVDTVGDLIALDFSAHDASAGVTIVQQFETPKDDTDDDGDLDTNDVTTPYIIGDILLGAGNDSISLLAGYLTGDIDYGTGDGALILDDAIVAGDVSFTDGQHTLSFNDAEFQGDITFTNSKATFSLMNDAIFYGSLITDNTDLSLSAVNSQIYLTAGNASLLTSLSVTGTSDLFFEIDPDDTSAPILSVSGSAFVGSEVTITPILTSLPDNLTTQTLISAGSLDFEGDFNDLQLEDIPWLYTTELVLTDGVVDTLDLVFVQKTAEELGLNKNETAAFSSLLGLFAADDDLGAAIASLSTENEFNKFYNLLIPQRTDASTRFLEAQASSAFGALDDFLETSAVQTDGGTRFWAQEYYVGLEQDASTENPGYNGGGFGMSIGVDRSYGKIDAIGFMVGFSSGEFEEKTGGNNPVSTTSVGVGVYAQEKLGPVDLRLASLVSKVKFDSHRDIEFSDSLSYNIEADWGGWSAALSANASSHFDIGPLYVKPSLALDYFTLSQDSYKEFGGDDLLDAAISSVTTDRLTATGLLALGVDWKTGDGFLRTELRGGYRNALSSTPYEADVRYLGSDETFTLTAEDKESTAALFGASVIHSGEFTTFNFGYDAEITDTGVTHFAGATVRVKF